MIVTPWALLEDFKFQKASSSFSPPSPGDLHPCEAGKKDHIAQRGQVTRPKSHS